MSPTANQLSKEKSPYLLQHRDNPVHWYAWGEEAFQAARQQQKPIFLSIGYSTCHWCHVMAHESFEDQEVADVLNKNFISIKVDREERPDVDEIYMAAIHALGQRGGWPLSMFLTPELKPFYGGTYWPKPVFLSILQQIHDQWVQQPDRMAEAGAKLISHLQEQKAATLSQVPLDTEIFSAFFRNSLVNFDRKFGGFGSAPKFPHAMQLSMLLRIHRRTGAEDALQMVVHTLDKMARGGIYDHLGGGFARYSTDARWLVPHFEKMLYDNALLAITYLEAYQVTGIEMFLRVATETLDYVLRTMTHPEGGFYSAEDADSEGVEGKFYVWKYDELESLLQPEALQSLVHAYQVRPAGNFEGANILHLNPEVGWLDKEEEPLKAAMAKLFSHREGRIHPHLDDKVLTAWNGLMIRAMAKGHQVTGEKRYLDAAHAAANFLKKNLFREGRLLARYREGEGRFAARLEDYAFLIQGLIELYQCDFRPEVLQWALELQGRQDNDFLDGETGAYFFTDGNDPHLLVRSREGMDGALPNANGVSAENLLRLFGFTGEGTYRDRAERIFQCFSALFSQYSHGFSQMLMAYDYYQEGGQELAVMAPAAAAGLDAVIKKIREGFYPHLVLAVSSGPVNFPPLLASRRGGQAGATFYLCEGQACQAPTQDAQAVMVSLGTPKTYELKP